MLSTFRNGGLVLWDLNKQCSDQAPPYARAMHRSLHSKEILGMHELNARIATASFDSSLVTSTITEAGIAKERVITGHHAGTISGVRFRYHVAVVITDFLIKLFLLFLLSFYTSKC